MPTPPPTPSDPTPTPNDTITLSLTQLAAIIRSEITHQLSDGPNAANRLAALGVYRAAIAIAESQIGTAFDAALFFTSSGKDLLYALPAIPSAPSNPNESAS